MPNTLPLFSWALKFLQTFWLQLLFFFKKTLSFTTSNESKFSAKDECQQQFSSNMPMAKGLPLVGTFFDFIAAGAAPKLHKYIDKRHQQLGPIFRECLGGTQDAVFVSSANLMRSVFLYEGQYPRHPLPDAWSVYNKKYNCKRGLFFMDGEEWFHNRRILNRFLLNGNLDWMEEYIGECTNKFINAWKIQATQAQNSDSDSYCEIVDLEPQLYRWAIDVICTIMFGSTAITCMHIEMALNEFSQIVHKIFESSAALMNFPSNLAKMLAMSKWSEFERNVTEVLQKGAEIIDAFVAWESDGDPEMTTADDVDYETSSLFHKLRAGGMSLSMIKRIFVDLVIAAGDTTAYTTEWALYLLSQDTILQQSMANEVFGSGDKKDLPLVRGFIRETLRLYPVAPFIGRYLACDSVIGGYHIKKDTLVLLSLYTSGRDVKHFSDPLVVKPERWQRNEETGELQQVFHAHGTLPFAIGTRSCIGRKIAANQIHSIIAAIASNFHLKCTNSSPIDCVLRLVTVPDQPLQLAIKLRENI